MLFKDIVNHRINTLRNAFYKSERKNQESFEGVKSKSAPKETCKVLME